MYTIYNTYKIQEMENNKPSVYESLKNTLSYISNNFFKSMSCTVRSTRTRSETLPSPMENLEGMKEPEQKSEPVNEVNEEDQIIAAPVKEEAVIVEEPIYIEDRI